MSGAFLGYLLLITAKTPEMVLLSRAFAGLMAGTIATAYATVADLTKPQVRAKGMGVLGAALGLGFVVGPMTGGFLGGSTPETATLVYPAIASAVFSSLAIMTALFLFKETLKQEYRDEVKTKPRVSRLVALKKFAKHPVLIRFCFFIFLVSTTGALMDPVTPLLIGERYDWGPRHMGYIFTVVGLLIAIVQGGLVGKIAAAIGEQNMVRLAFGLMVIGLGLIIYTPVSYGVVLGLCFAGVGSTLFTTGMSALISHRTAPTERGLAMGVVKSMQSLGRSIGPLFAGVLYVTWRELPYAAGVMLIIFAFAWMSYLMRTSDIEDASVRTIKN